MKKFSYILSFLFLAVIYSCSEDTIDNVSTGTITGTVVTDGDFEPIQNAKISTNPATSTVFTDENGKFKIADIPAVEYSVQARKDSLLSQFQGAEVLPDAEVNIVFEMKTEQSNNQSPKTPNLITPNDNAEALPIALDFVWEASDAEGDELTYQLEIKNDRNNEVLKYSEISDTTYRVDSLKYGYKYFWQIRVNDGTNEDVLSEVFTFKTLQFPKSRIAYVRKVNGNNVIFSRDLNEEEYQLTSSEENSFRPRKNRRTNKIAFLRTVGTQTQLFTMNLDGSNQKQITENIPLNAFNLNQIDFSWANDGATLYYPSFDKLYKVNADGSGTELVYKEPNGKFITEVDVSDDNSRIALLTNGVNGYNAEIYIIDKQGRKINTVIENEAGALGGVNISVDNKRILYARDISGFETDDYRRLNSQLFIHNLETGATKNISANKTEGTNDLDPRFSPNEAEVIFVNTSNDGVSVPSVLTTQINPGSSEEIRTVLYENAVMPDWE